MEVGRYPGLLNPNGRGFLVEKTFPGTERAETTWNVMKTPIVRIEVRDMMLLDGALDISIPLLNNENGLQETENETSIFPLYNQAF